jgi:hypothetical protein
MASKIQLNTLAGCKWWDITTKDSPLVPPASYPVTQDLASEVYEETLSAFELLMKKDSEQQWLRKVAATGTHSDQVAALVTLTQMSPVLGMHHVRQLLNLGQVKANRIVLPALIALKRLMIEHLLPSRKLNFFTASIASAQNKQGGITKTDLLLWQFEDFLKKSMATLVQILFDSQTSPIESLRTGCVDISFDLLAAIKGAAVTGEQEKPLLKLLVKALDDKAEKRVSAKASLFLGKLAKKRPHLKEQIVDEVREQHLVFSQPKTDYSRGISLACSFFSVFPLNKQDDAFVASKLIAVLSELVKGIIQKKQTRDKKRKLSSTCGLSEADARVLRLCLKGMETALSAADGDCPLPETTTSLLIRLSHETNIAGLSVSILNFLHRLSQQLKTDSPKLLRALYAQAATIETYLGSSLPWFLNLVKEAMLSEDAFSKESVKIAFRRRLVQAACCVTDPGVISVVLVLAELKQLEQTARDEDDDDAIISGEEKLAYNPAHWDPVAAGASSIWEKGLLAHHFDHTVRKAVDSAPVEVPESERNLCALLVEVSKLQLEKKKKKKVSMEDALVDLPGGGL